MSQALNSGLRNDIETYSRKLNQAMSLDENTTRTWDTNQDSLQLLKKGKNELDEMIPANDTQQNPNLHAEQLKNSLDLLNFEEQALNEILKALVSDT